MSRMLFCRQRWRRRLSFSREPGSCVGETGIYFGEGLCLLSHAALTSAGAQGFGSGKGRVGQRVEVGPGMELGGWGWGEMLHSGCCLALKSHLAVTLSPHPEGGWRTGGRGCWDGLDFSYGGTRLASWVEWNIDPSHNGGLLSFLSGRTSSMTLVRNLSFSDHPQDNASTSTKIISN